MQNKKKIINDPVYGFIGIPSNLVFDLISHPWLGRLRNIRQLGLTHLVYPGAVHTRFHHALGTLHLSNLAIETLRSKEIPISEEEADGLRAALLLHDIGHGPFSHSLENVLVKGSHEHITQIIMEKLNHEFGGRLQTAIEIFNNTYPKNYLHQLVSGQLDLDRLDYLNRDSFYTGVSEGVVSFDRIIKMLNVKEQELVLEEKALYSIEKFLIARRLMYWQVYLHKTVIASEQLLLKIVERARQRILLGDKIFASPSLLIFLEKIYTTVELSENESLLEAFLNLDDTDLWTSIKVWTYSEDKVLSDLSKALVNRNLYRIELQKEEFAKIQIQEYKELILQKEGVLEENLGYYLFQGRTRNLTYNQNLENINLQKKNGDILPFLELSDFFNSTEIANPIEKHFLCRFRF